MEGWKNRILQRGTKIRLGGLLSSEEWKPKDSFDRCLGRASEEWKNLKICSEDRVDFQRSEKGETKVLSGGPPIFE
ncbi:unnamed protein product [Rhizophagus irregularis]|nr:unnamed protein product [Rhizophagus irregularis]